MLLVLCRLPSDCQDDQEARCIEERFKQKGWGYMVRVRVRECAVAHRDKRSFGFPMNPKCRQFII